MYIISRPAAGEAALAKSRPNTLPLASDCIAARYVRYIRCRTRRLYIKWYSGYEATLLQCV